MGFVRGVRGPLGGRGLLAVGECSAPVRPDTVGALLVGMGALLGAPTHPRVRPLPDRPSDRSPGDPTAPTGPRRAHGGGSGVGGGHRSALSFGSVSGLSPAGQLIARRSGSGTAIPGPTGRFRATGPSGGLAHGAAGVAP